MDKNNNDEDYDGDDKHSVTNDNPAQERADIEELRALKKTQATRKSIGHLCSTKLNWLSNKVHGALWLSSTYHKMIRPPLS